MNNFLKRTMVFIATVIVLASGLDMNIYAAENQSIMELETVIEEYQCLSDFVPYSTTFCDTSVYISYSQSGMSVTIHTATTLEASVLGVKDIKVQRKSGNNWITVATASGGETTNNSGFACSFTYPNSVKGETYRVTCTHYANVDGYRELPHETLGAKCTY